MFRSLQTENLENHLERSDFTLIYMPAVCVYIVCTKKFADFQVSHTNFHSPESDNNQRSCSYTQLGGSCLAPCIGQHSQPSVCMTVREWTWGKKLVGLSICSLWHSVLLPVLWLMDKYTWRCQCSHSYRILWWLSLISELELNCL